MAKKKTYTRTGPKLSDKQKKKEARQRKSAAKKMRSGDTLAAFLNRSPVATLPLTPEEELIRQASVAGDFAAIHQVWPFDRRLWARKTPLGKYRFNIIDGGTGPEIQYVPFSESDLINFLNGPWMQQNPQTGYAGLVHPRRNMRKHPLRPDKKLKELSKKQSNAGNTRAANIFPGTYIYGPVLTSTWEKVREPVAVAALAVASVYLGPAVYAKFSAAFAKGAATSGTAAATSTAATGGATSAAASTVATSAGLFSKAKAASATLLGYVNKGRTVKAIVEGKVPPPPVSIEGDSFRDWAFDIAQKEMTDELQRQLTRQEEQQLKLEIAAMQRELAAIVPPGTPMSPNPNVPASVQQKSVELAMREKQGQDSMLLALAIAVPIILTLV